jgi:hypothetical protein
VARSSQYPRSRSRALPSTCALRASGVISYSTSPTFNDREVANPAAIKVRLRPPFFAPHAQTKTTRGNLDGILMRVPCAGYACIRHRVPRVEVPRFHTVLVLSFRRISSRPLLIGDAARGWLLKPPLGNGGRDVSCSNLCYVSRCNSRLEV